jgi:uncharacterized protein YqfA (UPF0365 family)
MFSLIGMRLRRTPPNLIVNCYILAKKGGLEITHFDLEATHMAGGNIAEIVSALLWARHEGFPLTYTEAFGLDLKFKNIRESLREIVEALEWAEEEHFPLTFEAALKYKIENKDIKEEVISQYEKSTK